MKLKFRALPAAAIIISSLTPLLSRAQAYQCLQPNVKHYFTNSNGYLRGIRIDSVKTYTDSTVFYPFHTPRGRHYNYVKPLDTTGGSWLGKRVVMLNDGTWLFDNIWGDTAVIRTQAHTGDTWRLYDDTTTLWYEANVISEDTMSVLGTLDSVKTIGITARNPPGIVADSANSFKLVLSKSHGFVQTIDLYTFPYHAPDSVYNRFDVDNFLDHVGGPSYANAIFRLIPFKWPLKTELYNFDVGDAYETKYCISEYGLDCMFPHAYDFDSITSKIVFPDSVQYTTTGWEIMQNQLSPGPYIDDHNYPYYPTQVVNKSFTVAAVPAFDTSLFPEEQGQLLTFSYFPGDNGWCLQSPLYTTLPNDVFPDGDVVTFFEGGGPYIKYKTGLNIVSDEQVGTGRSTDEVVGSMLIYWRLKGNTCGQYIGSDALAVEQLSHGENDIKVFPVPATNEITITSTADILTVDMYDFVSQQVATYTVNKKKATIDISSLPAGMYFACINKTVFRKFVKN